ncbi:hypothetical protein [Spiroplasma monobiae]|uniref:Uncharacterized protein n=1 Tax=Spiroplasma monobiae MQ-1 TaxID=1336748 RepID=A0A2K9LVJ2_SPISQ|nr:hypothetical protein [Spiroplasma monobiae]AUM62355.1 hypothetical protein SMONO_v1c01020 [Spiroplasma monobiae MQ-1]
MSEVKLNLKKMSRQKSPNNSSSRTNEFNGFRTLYLINLKRLVRNKAVIAMAIISLLVTLTMTSIVSSTMNSPDGASSIGLIIVSVQFICEIFFFIVFMIILSSELIKKQLLEGIQNIEIRSGMSYKKSFLLRWYVFMTFTMALALANSLLKIALSTNIVFQFNSLSLVIISTCIFFFFIGFVWTPVVFLITIICSIAWSIMLNVFITMLLVFSGMISSMGTLFEYQKTENNTLVARTNLKLEIGNSFYKTVKDDQTSEIKALFIDEDDEGNSILQKQLNNNLIVAGMEGNLKSTSIYFDYSFRNPYYNAALWGGAFNIKGNPKDGAQSNEYNPIIDTSIYYLLNDLFETVEKGMKSDNNKPPLSLPGYMGGFMDEYGSDSKFHDISPLLNWLAKQEQTKKYKTLLKWVDGFYSKYKFIIPSNKNLRTEEPFIFISDFRNSNYLLQEDQNKEIYKVYKRYPEMLIINNIITESWISSMVSKAELTYRGNSWNSTFKDPKEAYENYQEWTNGSILKNNLNIFQHFSTIHSQLFGSNTIKDMLFKDSLFGYTGITTGYKNLIDLASVDAREMENNSPLKPIFESVKLEKNNGFLVPIAFLIYLLIGTGSMYLIYLLWSRKSKI